MNRIVKEFKKYVKQFDISDFNIKRKIHHSLRVMKLSKLISKREKFSKEDIELATLIGLLHDYARFLQWTKYKTYSDMESVDHGDLASEMLFKNRDIEKFSFDKENYYIMDNAIKNHNKFEYSHKIDYKSIIHSDLIRDTDKLDIFYIFSKGILKHNCNYNVSDYIKKLFFENKLIKYKDVKNDSDRIILTLSMVYDINYKESLKQLKKKNYIWKFYNKLNNKEKYFEYFKHIDNYLEERLKQNVR